MSNSKFLPFQDVNGDGLNDACKDQVRIEEPKYCPDCIPNPNALVSNWRTLTKYEPFLNEKNCMYQIAITARDYDTTGAPDGATEEEAAAALKEIYEEYEDRVIEALLEVYGKDNSDASIELIKDVIEYTDYWLEIRHKSRLRLLYSVPYETLNALDEADEEDDEESESGDVEVTYTALDMDPKMMKIRKGLALYNRYLKVYRAVQSGNIFFSEDDRLFNLENYGDWGFGASVMSNVLPQLEGFLNKHGYNIPGVGGIGLFSGTDAITEITFTFTNEYVLKKLVFYTEGCGSKPTIFLKKCDDLNAQSAWKDPTAMAYFANMVNMETDLTARVPKPWTEFLEEYTYPSVYASGASLEADASAGSCVADALAEEAKQLGQDILDDVFSLGDAIAYMFHTNLCKESLGDATCEKVNFGIYPVKGSFHGHANVGQDCDASDAEGNMYGMAIEQAFQTLEKQDNPFNSFCARLLPQGTGGGSGMASCIAGGGAPGGAIQRQLDMIWKAGWDEIKLCGLFNILMEAIQCLFGGLTLEEALGSMIQSALQAMSINNFGDLFIGLPADKQAELDALVKEKLESGDIFKEDSSNQELSDVIAGEVEYTKPWEDESLSEEEKSSSPSTTGMTAEEMQSSPSSENRTLAQQLDIGGEDSRNQLSSSVVLEAYVKALLEVYQENLLELADELNKFPGAQLVSSILVSLDCPRPPIFNPGLMDWIHDIELPFCRNINDISWPDLQNPFGWLPKVKDLLRLLFEAIKCAIQMLLIKIMVKLIIKLCELIGNAICNALEAVGDIAASLPDLLTGRDNLRNVIKESICGEDADDDMIDDTILDMISSLGVGGAALANEEQALAFAEDLSASLTQLELTQALLGNATDGTLTILDSLIEYEYPDYRSAIPNKNAIGSLLGNMGNLMPAAFKDTMRDFADQIPANDATPANPTICLDPEKLDNFKEMRCQILDGRATPEQCTEMFDNMRGQMIDDLDDLGSVLQALSSPEGFAGYLEDNLPPMVSDPGCDNGILPFEPEVIASTATSALGGDFEQLMIDYSSDMLGNGPGEDNWGMINMMLSDTMGNPLTAHMRKAQMNPMYVDFYGDFAPDDKIMLGLFLWNPLLALALVPFMVNFQKGAFPTKVAAYLQETMDSVSDSITVDINNEWEPDDPWKSTMEELGFDGLFGQLDLLALPDYGYKTEMEPFLENDEIAGIKFTTLGRKADPDLTFSFDDNAKGLKATAESEYSWGFDVKAFIGDLEENEDGDIVNIMSDNMRILIEERVNLAANTNVAAAAMGGSALNSSFDGESDMTSDDMEEGAGAKLQNGGLSVLTTTKYEFMSVDNTLQGIAKDGTAMSSFLDDYPKFLGTFQTKQQYTPQSVLLKEILKGKNSDISITTSEIETLRGEIMKEFSSTVFADIADMEAEAEDSSWNFGAQFEDLSTEDIAYGINDDGEWIAYPDADYTNKDMVLGISYNQYKNEEAGTPEETRVFYLDPGKFGGSYVRPPIYIKPLKPEGWMGIVDVFFPELSPCKPNNTDLVDFDSIQDMIDDIYPTIPEDERLKSDPDCIVELPYNRIMERPAKAGMIGLIIASIRIFASVHFIKAIPTFTKFAPKFPEVFSSAYASFIVEDMEQTFKDVRSPWWELFNVFKGDEFWYGFLEQCVQSYAYLVDAGKIEAPALVLEALFRLNDMQEEYEYPFKPELKEARDTGDAGRFQLLKSYRLDKTLEAVRATEEDAKLIMKEFVVQQLNFMAKQFMGNLKRVGMAPEVHDLEYYLMENMTQGSSLTMNSALNHDGSFKATYGDLPEVPFEENEDVSEPYYTTGGELVVAEDLDETGLGVGEEYIGYYHVQLDEETGMPIYMAGEYHLEEEAHDTLKPFANIISVEIGDVDDIDTVTPANDPAQPFIIEKYISVNGEKMAPDDAVDEIKSNSDLTQLISEVYPGTMTLVEDEDGNPTGIEGELGVRYGLKFSLDVEGTAYELTTVEIDALDLPLSRFKSLTSNSMLLLCLVNHLKDDQIFTLSGQYIFPLNKLVSLAAIYNDIGMLPSIGELTVADGETTMKGLSFDNITKPGLQAVPQKTTEEDESGEEITVIESIKLGAMSQLNTILDSEESISSSAPDGAWASAKDRSPGFLGGIGVLEWDNWDQELLRNSTYRIKKLFKVYYNSRDFDPGKISKAGSPGKLTMKKLRGALKPAPGKQLLPWWKRRKLRTNPFNANDELCD